MRGIARRREQLIDQTCAFIGARIIEKRAHARHVGNHAGQIETDAAHELRVVGRQSRVDAGFTPAAGQQLVDAAGHLKMIRRRRLLAKDDVMARRHSRQDQRNGWYQNNAGHDCRPVSETASTTPR